MMKLIIAGSREFNDYAYLENKLDELLYGFDYEQITIISGACRGVDLLGEKYAKENNLPVITKHPNWDKYGKSAGFRRNREMAEIATHCVVFQVNNSKGSQLMIDLAKEYNLELTVFNPLPTIRCWQAKPRKTQLLTQQQTYKGNSIMAIAKIKTVGNLNYRPVKGFPENSTVVTQLEYSDSSNFDSVFIGANVTPLKANDGDIVLLIECSKVKDVTVNFEMDDDLEPIPKVLTLLLHSKNYKVYSPKEGKQVEIPPDEFERNLLAYFSNKIGKVYKGNFFLDSTNSLEEFDKFVFKGGTWVDFTPTEFPLLQSALADYSSANGGKGGYTAKPEKTYQQKADEKLQVVINYSWAIAFPDKALPTDKTVAVAVDLLENLKETGKLDILDRLMPM